MASATTPDILRLWEQSDATSERKLTKILLKGLDKVAKAQGDTLSKIKVLKPVSTPVIRWMEEIAYPTSLLVTFVNSTGVITITTANSINGTAVTADAAGGLLLKQVIRLGTIFEVPSSGKQIEVTDISGLATGNTVVGTAYGGTTLPADVSTAESWDIISEVWTDYTEVSIGRALDRGFREVGTQIHAETFEIPKTRKNTKYEMVANEVEHQIAELLMKLRRQLHYAVLRIRPNNGLSSPKYATQVQDSTMIGLTVWPALLQAEAANTAVYVNNSSTPITYNVVNTLAKNMWLTENANFKQGKWALICHPNQFDQVQTWDYSFRRSTMDSTKVGAGVNTIHLNSVGKDVELINEQYQRPGVMTLVNLAAAGYGYYNNDKMDKKEIPTKGRFQQWLVSFQTYGVVLRSPRTNIGQIYGIS